MVWKRNRNLYTQLLLNQIVTYGKLDKTFIQKPCDDGSQLHSLSKTEVTSQLSQKYKQVTNNFDAQEIRKRLLSPDQIDDDNYTTQEQFEDDASIYGYQQSS